MSKIRYRINKQGYGSLMDADAVLVPRELVIEIDAEGETVKLVSGANGSPFYERVRNGECKFPREALFGNLGISVINTRGTIPCTPLIAAETVNGVLVFPDAREILSRLERVERDISDTLVIHRELEGKYNELTQRLDKLFRGFDL